MRIYIIALACWDEGHRIDDGEEFHCGAPLTEYIMGVETNFARARNKAFQLCGHADDRTFVHIHTVNPPAEFPDGLNNELPWAAIKENHTFEVEDVGGVTKYKQTHFGDPDE